MAKYYIKTPLGCWFRAPGHGTTMDKAEAHMYDLSEYRDMLWAADIAQSSQRCTGRKIRLQEVKDA